MPQHDALDRAQEQEESPVPPDDINAHWIPKKEAARILGVSPRQVERRIEQGMLRRMTLPRRPHEVAPPVLINSDDILAIREGTPNYHQVVEVTPPPPIVENHHSKRQSKLPAADGSSAAPAEHGAGNVRSFPSADSVLSNSAVETLARVLAAFPPLISAAAQSPAPVAQPQKLWLTIEAAAELSGLPNHLLRRACVRKELVSTSYWVKATPEHKARREWMINRYALERWQGPALSHESHESNELNESSTAAIG